MDYDNIPIMWMWCGVILAPIAAATDNTDDDRLYWQYQL